MVSTDDIRRLKDVVPLLTEVQGIVNLKQRSGSTWIGLCPFHREKTASFTVHDHSDAKRPSFYRCFGCDAHGDVIDFHARLNGISKGRAIRDLATIHGVDLTPHPRPTRAQAAFTSDLRHQAQFWWAVRRAWALQALEDACARYFDAAERLEDLQQPGRRAESCGQFLRWIDGLDAAARGRIFLIARNDFDLLQFRRSVDSSDLQTALRKRDS